MTAEIIVTAFNNIGCHAFSPGSKDFAAGLDFSQNMQMLANFPFISANIIDSKTNKNLFPPHHIIENEGLSVGVIGLTDLVPPHVRRVKIEDFITVGKAQIAELRNKVDIVVVLANVNRDKNKLMNELFLTDIQYALSQYCYNNICGNR